MEVYLKKKDLPKNCFNCPCFNHEFMNCNLDDEEKGFFLDEIDGGECPLKTIEDEENKQLKAELKQQTKIIENGNQRLLDYYNEKINELDKDYNDDLEERLKIIEQLETENKNLKENNKSKLVELFDAENKKLKKFEKKWNTMKKYVEQKYLEHQPTLNDALVYDEDYFTKNNYQLIEKMIFDKIQELEKEGE